MSVYAPVPAFAQAKRHPRALVVIVAVHALLIGAVMTAKMDLPRRVFTPITVDLIPQPKVPPENPPPPKPEQRHESVLDRPTAVVPIPAVPDNPVIPTPLPLPQPDPGPVIDTGPSQLVQPPATARTEPRFATPDFDIRPPYPDSKLRMGEEAVLQLRLTIDQRGRVTSVEPVGKADRVFLDAARRHLIAHWRYKPATEDGRPVVSSTVVTLRFELDR